ncbi:MAG: 30S ribosome-binding factor RbfA [Planctomycetota bacterium]
MPGNRKERIARVIREEASRVILYELADPRIGFVTVTNVKVSGDLQTAKIFVSVLGTPGDRSKTMHALARATKVVRKAVAPRLKTRLIPSISFEFDESVEGAIRVQGLIKEARATDSDAPRPDGGAPVDQDAGGADEATDRETDGGADDTPDAPDKD